MRVVHYCVPVNYGSVIVHHDKVSNFYDQLHKHNETQITLIVEGEGTLIVGNYMQRFAAGDVYLIGAKDAHVFKAPTASNNNENYKEPRAIHIFFDGDEKIGSFIELPELENIKEFLKGKDRSLQLDSRFGSVAGEQINKIHAAEGLERLLALIRLLHFFASEADGWKCLSTGFYQQLAYTTGEERMNDILRYATENYMKDISLEKIASVAHLSPPAFCKYFKKHTMKTWVRFINERRIQEACRKIIRNGGDSIASAAYSSGFKNLITFNRVFKKITGVCPTTYLKNNKNTSLSH